MESCLAFHTGVLGMDVVFDVEPAGAGLEEVTGYRGRRGTSPDYPPRSADGRRLCRDRVDRPVDPLLADRPRRAELLRPQADPQLLDHPADVEDVLGGGAAL